MYVILTFSGVTEQYLFNLYMDKLIAQLKREDIGCHIGHKFVGCLCYADDLTLLSPSIKGLQRMIQICESFGIEYGVSYNSGKTMCIAFSKQEQVPNITLYLNKTKLQWCNQVKYLGIYLSHDLDDKYDIIRKRSEFYGSVNSMLGNFSSLPCAIFNNLFCSFCTAFYGSQSWSSRCKELTLLYSGYNRALRRIWKLPINACYIVYILSNQPNLQKQLDTRYLKMLDCMLNCGNSLTNFLVNRSYYDIQCLIGNNYAYIGKKYNFSATKTSNCLWIKSVHKNSLR